MKRGEPPTQTTAARDSNGKSPHSTPARSNPFADMFRSLSVLNYRLWFSGALVSNVGTWMQRTAQDWIVLTQLSDNDALAVGWVMALQFAPQIVFLPVSGWVADRFDRRKLLMVTQGVMALLALGLGLLTVTHAVQLWHVYVFAGLLGTAAAFDAPVRQTFVGDLVGTKLLGNAVALNSASFNSARLIGPAVAGGLTVLVGAGWVFLINAISFIAVFITLGRIKVDRGVGQKAGTSGSSTIDSGASKSGRKGGSLIGGFRYLAKRPDLVLVMTMIFIVGTFGLNFPIFVSTMASTVFGKGAGEYGLLSTFMAIGAVVGALLAARRAKPRASMMIVACLFFGVGYIGGALAPNYWFLGIMLIVVGVCTQTFTTTANATVQLGTDARVRGRVMAIYMTIFMGGTPLGAPIVGWVANEFGPRWALGIGGSSGFIAAVIGLFYLSLMKKRGALAESETSRERITQEGSAEGEGEPEAPKDVG